MDADTIRAGIASGELVRGSVERQAEGTGDRPVMGEYIDLMTPTRVWPELPPDRGIVALEVVGPGYAWSAAVTRWRVPVLAVARAATVVDKPA